MSTKGRKFLDRFVKEHSEGQGYSDELNALFSDYITENFSGMLIEDHEKKMTSKEMSKHIQMLYKMCEDEETEKKFLKRLAKACGKDSVSEKDIKSCANDLCDLDEEKCDDVIHTLEGMVGYEHSEKDDDDDDDSDDDKKKDDDSDDDSDDDKDKKKK